MTAAWQHSSAPQHLLLKEQPSLKGAVQVCCMLHLGHVLVPAGSHGYVDLGEHNSCELSQRVQAVKRCPRYSLMIAIKKGAVQAPFDGVMVINSKVIEWLSNDSSKPGKSVPQCTCTLTMVLRLQTSRVYILHAQQAQLHCVSSGVEDYNDSV